MKIVSKNKGIFTFSKFHHPVMQLNLGEVLLLETEDAVGGQVKDENTRLKNLTGIRSIKPLDLYTSMELKAETHL